MELGFIEELDGIDAAIWIGSPGSSGINALGKILNGSVNPSGRLVDTFATDFTADYLSIFYLSLKVPVHLLIHGTYI